MLTKEQAERIKELAGKLSSAEAEAQWQLDQGHIEHQIKAAEKGLSEARLAFADYLDELTEKPEPAKLCRFKVRYRLADGLSAKTVLMDLPSIDQAWDEARKFAREQGPSCRIEGIEEVL